MRPVAKILQQNIEIVSDVHSKRYIKLTVFSGIHRPKNTQVYVHHLFGPTYNETFLSENFKEEEPGMWTQKILCPDETADKVFRGLARLQLTP